MSNTYFDFKHFKIEQDSCAMKVGTDSILLGAWVGKILSSFLEKEHFLKVLDVGSGSSILSLMIAQQLAAKIDLKEGLPKQKQYEITAVEIDEMAATQGRENVLNSPWKDNIKVHNSDIKEWIEQGEVKEKFDIVVCNPPFFVDSLKCENASKTRARHAVSLDINTLMYCSFLATKNASETENLPVLFLVFPAQEEEELLKVALDNGFETSCINRVYTNSKREKPERILVSFAKTNATNALNTISAAKIENFHVYDSVGVYSKEFKELTKDFYLDF